MGSEQDQAVRVLLLSLGWSFASPKMWKVLKHPPGWCPCSKHSSPGMLLLKSFIFQTPILHRSVSTHPSPHPKKLRRRKISTCIGIFIRDTEVSQVPDFRALARSGSASLAAGEQLLNGSRATCG